MQGKDKERWRMLYEQAAVEQDGEKLMKLVAEIDAPLEPNRKDLMREGSTGSPGK
jgi:hypothetical protein